MRGFFTPFRMTVCEGMTVDRSKLWYSLHNAPNLLFLRLIDRYISVLAR
jgi:hypothetical protein